MNCVRFALLALALSGCATKQGAGDETNSGTREGASLRVDKASVQREVTAGKGFCYPDPMDPTRFGNAFRMSNGHILVISLVADSDRGRYAGDRIAIWDITVNSGWVYGLSESPRNDEVTDERYLVTFERTSKDLIVHVSGVSASFNDLGRWRTQVETVDANVGTSRFKSCVQGRDGAILFFSENAAMAWLDPEAPKESYAPTYVVPTNRKLADGTWEELSKSAIGDTGYMIQRRPDGNFDVVLAK